MFHKIGLSVLFVIVTCNANSEYESKLIIPQSRSGDENLNLCDNSHCSNEGICRLDEKNVKICDCAWNVVEGKKCEVFVDYCATARCENGGTCQ